MDSFPVWLLHFEYIFVYERENCVIISELQLIYPSIFVYTYIYVYRRFVCVFVYFFFFFIWVCFYKEAIQEMKENMKTLSNCPIFIFLGLFFVDSVFIYWRNYNVRNVTISAETHIVKIISKLLKRNMLRMIVECGNLTTLKFR